MNPYPYTFLLLFIISFVWRGCQEEGGMQVDERYVESSQYEQFRRDIDREQNRRQRSLEEYIQRIAECELPENMPLPLRISGERLEELVSNAPDECGEYEAEYQTAVLGKSEMDDLDLIWLLVESQSVFEEKELILITRKGGELREFRTIGIFTENLSTTEETFIQVDPQEQGAVIYTETQSRRQYPISQQQEIKSEYIVNSLGQIQEA